MAKMLPSSPSLSFSKLSKKHLRLHPLKLLFSILLLIFTSFWWYQQEFQWTLARQIPPSPSSEPSSPPLPLDYTSTSAARDDGWCSARYGLDYLTGLRDSAVSYCTKESPADVFCHWSRTSEDNRNDAMCYGRGATFDATSKAFKLDCTMRELSDEENQSRVPKIPIDLTRYWYETGPGSIVHENHLQFVDGGDSRPSSSPERTTILVKREGSTNIWHSLMEIMSLSWTLDVLQLVPVNQGSHEPLLDPASGNRTQIVLLDDHEDGPYIELWRLFAQMPVRRISDLSTDEPSSNIILPLSGGSNTLWQGDWEPLNCRTGELIRTFADRVIKHYDVPQPECQEVITVTYIKRTGARRLLNEDDHIAHLKEALPHAVVEVVQFEQLTFEQQLETVRRTDVLVGVHGAGLTHALFLRPGSAIVEVLPEGFKHQGFRNTAQLMGHDYVRTHASRQPDSVDRDDRWQMEAVQISKAKLTEAVEIGVKGLYSSCRRSYDAS